MPERLLKPGPAAWIAQVILCVVLIVLAVLSLWVGAGFWLTFLFFFAGIAGLWIAFHVAKGEAAFLKLDEAGFTRKTPYTTHRHDWRDVSAFSVVETWPKIGGFSKKVVAFRRLDSEEKDVFSAITDLFNPAKGFGHNYDMEPDHLADLLNDYRAAALSSQPSLEASSGTASADEQKSAENSPQGDH